MRDSSFCGTTGQYKALFKIHFFILVRDELMRFLGQKVIRAMTRPNVVKFHLLDKGIPVDSLLSKFYKKNSSGAEIANVNFLYDDIEHALQNIIDSYINSAMHRLTPLSVGTQVYRIQ